MSSSPRHKPGYVPLSYCVNQALVELDDFSEIYRDKYTTIAIAGFRELQFTSINSIQVAHLTMDELNNVKMPDDYVRYVKVGVRNGNRVWNLVVDNDIILERGYECGEDAREIFNSPNANNYPYGFYYTGHFYNGEYKDALYGVGAGYRQNYFREDFERGLLSFDSPVPQSKIILEYKSDGISSQTLVPKEAINAIVEYIHWRRLKHKDPARARDAKRDFYEAQMALKSLNNAFNISEYLDSMRSTYYQTPKR